MMQYAVGRTSTGEALTKYGANRKATEALVRKFNRSERTEEYTVLAREVPRAA